MALWNAALGSALLALQTAAVSETRRNPGPPTLRAAPARETVLLDGRLDEPSWALAPAIDHLTMVEPVEGGVPAYPTSVKVLADSRALYVGIRCEDAHPDGLVGHSVARDAPLGSEDHVRVILGPFRDGRSGYVFAVNPAGARYDALITRNGESENPEWDGLWEARTSRDEMGWTVEMRVPVSTIAFPAGQTSWHFNVQRRVQRLLETSRWAGARLRYRSTQTAHAGLLTDLPEFDLGLGLSVRPALVLRVQDPAPGARARAEAEPSLDVIQRLGPNILAQLTVNTDFAETEADLRRTNLSRFPLFYPEKRTFFLEGSDVFDFGPGLGTDVVAFHSRRIGLVDGREVPLLYGGKLHGRAEDTAVGVVGVRTDELEGTAPETGLAVARVKRNVLEESTVGALAAYGDPLGRSGSWTVGADATYRTSRFLGEHNLLGGLWALATGREDLAGDSSDRSSFGARVAYPNAPWDLGASSKRIGPDFDPSLAFVPRRSVWKHDAGIGFSPRPEGGPVRRLHVGAVGTYVTDLEGIWESYAVTFTPLNLDFESGEDLEARIFWAGDRPPEPFELPDGVQVAPGTYRWRRYEVVLESAAKRPLRGKLSWEFGSYYDGRLDEFNARAAWDPFPILTLEAWWEKDVGRLEGGRIEVDLFGTRLRWNFAPDLYASSLVQYDTESRRMGTQVRLHWTVTETSDLFFVVAYDADRREGQWDRHSYGAALKIQYALLF
jgi:hypothetical protein